MSYEDFKAKVLDWARALGVKVRFNHTNGRHYANFSDGTVITANTVALSVSIRWGSGHTAIAQL